jgi:hypothetical protein
MAINAMAPFILCARLKGLMCRGQEHCSGSSSSAGAGAGGSASMAESSLESLRTASSRQERGKAVGGAAPRPRRDREGGPDLEGSTASHGVPEFMQEDAEKQGCNKGYFADRSRPPSILPSSESKKGRQKQESDMNPDIDA